MVYAARSHCELRPRGDGHRPGCRRRDSIRVSRNFKGLRGGKVSLHNSRAAPPTCETNLDWTPLMRGRGWSAAHPCTTSCRFEASEPIPFPGADSIFSSRCGAISRRLRLPSASRGAKPATEMPRFSPRAGFGGIGRLSGAARRSSSAESEISFRVSRNFKGLRGGKFPFDFAAGRIRRDRAALRRGEALQRRTRGAVNGSARAICATESPFVGRSRIRSRRSAVLRRGAMRAAASTAGADASWGRWLLDRLAMTEIRGRRRAMKSSNTNSDSQKEKF